MAALTLLISGAALATALIAGAALALASLRRWPAIGLFAVGSIALLEWEFPSLPPLLTFGGIEFKVEDVVVCIMALDVVLQPTKFIRLTRKIQPAVIVTGICVAASLIVGMLIFGPAAANESRTFIWGLVLAAWMLNQDWGYARFSLTFRRWTVVMGVALVLLFAYHVTKYGFGTADTFVTAATGIEQTSRPLVSAQAALLAGLGLIVISNASQRRWRAQIPWIFLGSVFVLVALACQHRSVWAAMAVGIAVNVVRLRRVALARTIVGLFFMGVVFAVIVATGALNNVLSDLVSSATNSGTYDGRTEAWSILIQDSFQRGAWSVLFGQPFGFGFTRIQDGMLLEFAPHNWYVSIFLRVGLVGLFTFVSLLGAILYRLMKPAKDVGATSVLLLVAVYCWSYSLSWYLVPLLAFAIVSAYRYPQPAEVSDSSSGVAGPERNRIHPRREGSRPFGRRAQLLRQDENFLSAAAAATRAVRPR